MESLEITDVREMENEEYGELYWEQSSTRSRAKVLVLEDGTRIFASCDPEGNHEGFFVGVHQAEDDIVGTTIETVAPMSDSAMKRRGWQVGNPHIPAPPVLSLSTGLSIYPAADPEENRPGALFGFEPDSGETFMLGFEEDPDEE